MKHLLFPLPLPEKHHRLPLLCLAFGLQTDDSTVNIVNGASLDVSQNAHVKFPGLVPE